MLHHYSVYQLVVRSELRLPELSVVSPGRADITVSLDLIKPDDFVGARQIGPYLWAQADALVLRVPDVADFKISGGTSVTIQPCEAVDEESIRVFLLGSAFGALMLQRRNLVLHGNAIRVDDGCLVCVGPSGAGKSTLAAALVRRGFAHLADDVVPINGQGEALPGFARLKLWQDSVNKLGLDAESLVRIRPGINKFNVPVASATASTPVAVRWIYLLAEHNRSDYLIERITGMQRFQLLRENTYRMRFVGGLQLSSNHLDLCGKLAKQVLLTRIVRPSKSFAVEELADRLLEDLHAQP